jgi:membrane dipeptidase
MDAQMLHDSSLVWDAHRDVAYELPYEQRYLQPELEGVDLQLDRLKAGGISVQTYAICIGMGLGLPPTAQALKEWDRVIAIVAEHKDEAEIVTTTAQALAAREQGKIAIFLNFEGGEPILTDLGLLRMFYRMGLRAMGLTWNFRNAIADGGYEGREGGGLSQFGLTVVREMNRLGMVVDLAHLTPQSMRDVLRISQHPVIHSHGGVRAINPDHPRTLDDAMLEAIAANGGLFCVTTVPQAISVHAPEGATFERFLDAIDHAVHVMGADHVGLGADFDVYQSHLAAPVGVWTEGIEEADCWPKITAGLLARGYAESDVRLILGENLLRVYRQVVG